MPETPLNPIISSATVGSTVNRVNEDTATHFSDKANFHIAVADGVGTSSHAKEASDYVITQYQKVLQENEGDIDTYKTIQSLLQNTFTLEDDSYETTLITLCQNNLHQFIIDYAGNGCIFHLKGNFWEQKTPSNIPWNLVNYLSPHSISENGKEVLYNYFSNDKNAEISSTRLEINQDPYFGDIFIIGTDGLFSADQKVVGKNKSGTWQKHPELLLNFFDEFSSFFINNEKLKSESLQSWLELFLKQNQEQKKLDDDTSIGILISSTAVRFHLKQKGNH